jgi:hypothetical protein
MMLPPLVRSNDADRERRPINLRRDLARYESGIRVRQSRGRTGGAGLVSGICVTGWNKLVPTEMLAIFLSTTPHATLLTLFPLLCPLHSHARQQRPTPTPSPSSSSTTATAVPGRSANSPSVNSPHISIKWAFILKLAIFFTIQLTSILLICFFEESTTWIRGLAYSFVYHPERPRGYWSGELLILS